MITDDFERHSLGPNWSMTYVPYCDYVMSVRLTDTTTNATWIRDWNG